MVEISESGGVYTETATEPVQVTGSSCYLPAGTVISTFKVSGGGYSGEHGLWFMSCSFDKEAPMTLKLEGNTLSGEIVGIERLVYTRQALAAPPKASIESPTSGGTDQQGAAVTTRFSCTEGEDGPGIESCMDSSGGSGTTGTLETSTLGPHTYTVTAKSTDGQTGTASISYTVLGAQHITFTSTAPASATVGGVSYTVAATGGASGNPVTFSSGAPTVCSISGATVSFTGAGTCTIDANQAGNADYLSAPQVTQSFTVTPKPNDTKRSPRSPPSASHPQNSASATASSQSTYGRCLDHMGQRDHQDQPQAHKDPGPLPRHRAREPRGPAQGHVRAVDHRRGEQRAISDRDADLSHVRPEKQKPLRRHRSSSASTAEPR